MSQGNFDRFDANRFVIDSHRGAFKEGLLENTVEAFMQSYREGANVMECDIRLTKDNQIVLIHNGTIDHIASFAEKIPDNNEFNEQPTGSVRSHTLAYLKALKFPNNAKLMSLPELLNFLNKIMVGAQIELKEGGYEDAILKTIEAAEIDYEALLGPIVCTSFNYVAVMRLVKKAKKYRIPLYTHKGTPGLAFGFQAVPIGSIFGSFFLKRFEKHQVWGGMTHFRYMPVKQVALAHKHGVKFCPRVPDDVGLINAYIDAGVDGFETDNVPFIRKCAEAKGVNLWPLPK